MPTLRDFLTRAADHFSLDRKQVDAFEARLCEDLGGLRIHVPAPRPAPVAERIAELGHLPARVVAKRLNVSRSWVYAVRRGT
jgi:hypothetical protein